MKVLFVASNPDKQATLQLEREITELQRTAVGLSTGTVEFIFLPSLPFENLPEEISKHKPDVLHISAHGDDGQLALANEASELVPLNAEMLDVFLNIEPPPSLLYLNACNSADLARKLVGRVAMTIGTTAPITNRAASKAAANFYSRLLDGKSVKAAFDTCKMIMKGLNSADIDANLFCDAGCDPAVRYMHVATRLAARFWKDRTRPDGSGDYGIEVGLFGAPRNTTQVVFFTDDETFITKNDTLESDLCAVARTTPIRGEIWLGDEWKTYGDFRLFACGITAGGEHYSASSTLCSALEAYYLADKRRAPNQTNAIQRAIALLRSQDGSSNPTSGDNPVRLKRGRD